MLGRRAESATTDAPGGDGWQRLPFGPELGGVLFLVPGALLGPGNFGSLRPPAHEDLVTATWASAPPLLSR